MKATRDKQTVEPKLIKPLQVKRVQAWRLGEEIALLSLAGIRGNLLPAPACGITPGAQNSAA